MGRKTNHPGLYKRERYWWLTKDPVTLKPESTGCVTLKAAFAVQAQRERLAADPAYAASVTQTLGDHASRYLALKKRSGLSPETIKYTAEKLGPAVRIFGNGAPLASLGPQALDDYTQQRRDEGVTDHTICKEVRHIIAVLRSAKRVAAYAGNLDALWPEGLTPKYKPRERAMPMAEVRLLASALRPKFRALLNVSVALGIRLGEACRVKPGDIDLQSGLVLIRGTKTEAARRTIPILSPFRDMLEEALTSCQLPIGKRPNNIHRDIGAACRRVGISHVSPNDFRRSHTTILAELGAEAEQLRKLLGHTSTAMVDRVYAKPRALELGVLVERSIGVVPIAQVGLPTTGPVVANCTKPGVESLATCTGDGFRSRRSEDRSLSGARKTRGPGGKAGLPGEQRSAGVAVRYSIPQLALAYAALAAGVPANDNSGAGTRVA